MSLVFETTDLRDWQLRHGFTNPKAADALGVSLSTYKRMLKKETQHVLVLKAMNQIDHDAAEVEKYVSAVWSAMPEICKPDLESASDEQKAEIEKYHDHIAQIYKEAIANLESELRSIKDMMVIKIDAPIQRITLKCTLVDCQEIAK